MKNSHQVERRATKPILTVSWGHHGKRKRINAKRNHEAIFEKLAGRNTKYFEKLGKNDHKRKSDAIRSLIHLHAYNDYLEELDRIDLRLSYLRTKIRELKILHEMESDWMNIKRETRVLRMDYELAMQSRKYFLELSRRKLEEIRRIGVIMIVKMEEFQLFKKVREEVGLDVRIAVLDPDDMRRAEKKLREFEIL